MRSHFFVPRVSIEETTGPNWMKFCMRPPRGITRWIVEGFLEIRSRSPAMGYPWNPQGVPNLLKNFFPIFQRKFTEMRHWMSNSLIIVRISPLLNHFQRFRGLINDSVHISTNPRHSKMTQNDRIKD